MLRDTARPDRIAWWPSVIAAGVPLALIVCDASPLGTNFVYVMVGIAALLLFWTIAAIIAAVWLVITLRTRAWRKALSLVVLPVAVLASAPAPLAFVRFCNRVGDTIHFEVMRSRYQLIVDSMPGKGEPKLKTFNWGGMLWASRGVVYDQSDELTLPLEKRSAAWRIRASNSDLVCEGYHVTPIGNHFYLAGFTC